MSCNLPILAAAGQRQIVSMGKGAFRVEEVSPLCVVRNSSHVAKNWDQIMKVICNLIYTKYWCLSRRLLNKLRTIGHISYL